MGGYGGAAVTGAGTSGWIIGARLLIAVLSVIGAWLTLTNTLLKQEAGRPAGTVVVDNGGGTGGSEWDSPFGNGRCDGGYDADAECYP